MKAKALFLGTGASTGIPVIGCDCSVCTSSNAKNERMRPSLFVEVNNKKLLIDVGPDFRPQALKYHINDIDGVLLTHAHYDHIGGVDDLRILYFMKQHPIPCLLSKECFQEVKSRYEHLFRRATKKTSLSVQFDFTLVEEDAGVVEFVGIKVGYFTYMQGNTKVLGYRIGDLAYITDIKDYEESIFTNLLGVKTLIISALREKISPVQFNFEEARALAEKAKVEKVYITHIAHETDHEKDGKKLPANMQFAFDGLKIDFLYGV